ARHRNPGPRDRLRPLQPSPELARGSCDDRDQRRRPLRPVLPPRVHRLLHGAARQPATCWRRQESESTNWRREPAMTTERDMGSHRHRDVAGVMMLLAALFAVFLILLPVAS